MFSNPKHMDGAQQAGQQPVLSVDSKTIQAAMQHNSNKLCRYGAVKLPRQHLVNRYLVKHRLAVATDNDQEAKRPKSMGEDRASCWNNPVLSEQPKQSTDQ